MKKTTKKVLALTSGAVLLVSASVLGTMAYFTSTTQTVTNTFTVGKVEITLDEAHVNEYGKKVDEQRVTGNEYKLIPGHSYVKDPTVTVKADSEESYVRMFVTINNYSDLQDIFDGQFLPEKFVKGWDKSIWESKQIAVTNDTASYEFRYHQTVDTTVDTDPSTEDIELEPLFTTIEVPAELTAEDLAKIDDLEINVVAYAIQADGFEDADTAWENWD